MTNKMSEAMVPEAIYHRLWRHDCRNECRHRGFGSLNGHDFAERAR